MKKKIDEDALKIGILACIFVAIPTFFIIFLLVYESNLKKFKNQILFLDPSWVCTTSYDGDNIVLADDNQKKMMLILSTYHGEIMLQEPAIEDSIEFEFTRDEKKWNLTISKTDKECLKLDLVGEQDYHTYMKETQYYDVFLRLASPEGVEVKNKVLGNKM